MKFTSSSFLLVAALCLSACHRPHPAAEQPVFQAIAAKLTINDKQIDSVIEWNTKTGDARLLSAAVVTDKASGHSAPVIGWISLQDFQQSLQSVASQMHAQEDSKAAESPSSTPIAPKNE